MGWKSAPFPSIASRFRGFLYTFSPRAVLGQPRPAKTSPRSAQDALGPQDRPKTGQDRPKTGPDRPKSCPDQPKAGPDRKDQGGIFKVDPPYQVGLKTLGRELMKGGIPPLLRKNVFRLRRPSILLSSEGAGPCFWDLFRRLKGRYYLGLALLKVRQDVGRLCYQSCLRKSKTPRVYIAKWS